MAAKTGRKWAEVIADARRLLKSAGITPPAGKGSKALGKAKRLTYRYPVNGIPGAMPSREARKGLPRPPRRQRSNEPLESEHRELCVLGLRVWLAGLAPGDGQGQREFGDWAEGADWPRHSRFAQHGGLTVLRAEARAANAASRRQHGAEVTAADLGRANELRGLLGTRASSSARPAPAGPTRGRALPSQSVPFAKALRTVLAGPTKEKLAPKQ